MDAATPETADLWTKVRDNLHVKLRSASSYVVAAASYFGGKWLLMTEAEQKAWLTAHDVVAPLIPYVGFITFAVWVIAALWPQFITKPSEAAAAANATVQKLNELAKTLAAHKQVLAAVTSSQPVPPAAAAVVGLPPQAIAPVAAVNIGDGMVAALAALSPDTTPEALEVAAKVMRTNRNPAAGRKVDVPV